MAKELFEIKKNKEGYGFLIERDAGSISLDDERNSKAFGEINKVGGGPGIVIEDHLIVYAVFQKYGLENANGRVYPESVLKKQVALYQDKIDDRRSVGELNHPESVTLDGRSLSHMITKLWWENKTLVGSMEIIMSPGFVKYGIISCEGDKVANYLRLGIKIGVSSRGLGSVEQEKYSGKYIVQDDFEITCWDIVLDPSTSSAWISDTYEKLNPYLESKQTNKAKINEGLDSFLEDKEIL